MVEIKPGFELDRAVANAIGDAGQKFFAASCDDGESWCASTQCDIWPTRMSLEDWPKHRHANGTHLDYKVAEVYLYRPYSTNVNAAFEAAEKVVRRVLGRMKLDIDWFLKLASITNVLCRGPKVATPLDGCIRRLVDVARRQHWPFVRQF